MTAVSDRIQSQQLPVAMSFDRSQFPDGILMASALSAVGSYAVTFVLTGATNYALAAGVLGVVATLVDALVRPLMNNIFGRTMESDGLLRRITNSVVVVSLVALAMPYLAPALKIHAAINVMETAMGIAITQLLTGATSPRDAAWHFWFIR